MDTRTYQIMRAAAYFFMAAVVATSLWLNNWLLAAVGVGVGLLLLAVLRARAQAADDERAQAIREKAALAAYGIFAATIGASAVVLLFFSKRGFLYLEALGLILAYLTLFLIALYAVSYAFFNRKFGGGGEE
jgi:uncharacterized membrane protein